MGANVHFAAMLYVVSMTVTGLVPPVTMMFLFSVSAANRDSLLFVSQILYLGSLATTVSKAGLDQWAFSSTLREDVRSIDYRRLLRHRVLPLACVSALSIGAASHDILVAVCVAVSAFIDAPSAIRASELTALGRYKAVVLASWLNLPAFMLLVALLISSGPTAREVITAIFAVTSIARFLALYRDVSRGTNDQLISVRETLGMIEQQVLNLFMFRVDAFTASLLPRAALPTLSSLMYLMRIPDIAGNGAALLSSALVPRARSLRPWHWAAIAMMWVVGTAAVTSIATILTPTPAVSELCMLLVCVNASLALFATLETQILLAHKGVSSILGTLRGCAVLGAAITSGIALSGNWELLPLAATAQLVTFTTACGRQLRSIKR
jgi:hypothetical protein